MAAQGAERAGLTYVGSGARSKTLEGGAVGLINIDDIRAGMVLAENVTDQRGRVLLTMGCEITEKHLRILRMWGIVEADMRGVERADAVAQALADVDPAALQRAEESARRLFALTDLGHPAVQELFRQCTLRLARRTSNGECHAA